MLASDTVTQVSARASRRATLEMYFIQCARRLRGATTRVGPAFSDPTATNYLLGPDKWGAGPTGVALVQKGPWTTGVLWNHIWSFAGDNNDADINQTFVQPFVAYSLGGGQTISGNIQASY